MQDEEFQALLKRDSLNDQDVNYAFSGFSRVQLDGLRKVLYQNKDVTSFYGLHNSLRHCFNHVNPPKAILFRKMDDFLKYLEVYRLYKLKPLSSFTQFLKDHGPPGWSWELLLGCSLILGFVFYLKRVDAYLNGELSMISPEPLEGRILWAGAISWLGFMFPLALASIAVTLILGPLIVFIFSVGAYFLAQKRSSESSRKLDDAYGDLAVALLNPYRGVMVVLAQLFYPKKKAEETPSLGGMPPDIIDCIVEQFCEDDEATKIAAVGIFTRMRTMRSLNREELPVSLCETSQAATSARNSP